MQRILTDDRVTTTVATYTKGEIGSREILGVVQWVDHEREVAEVYWETGETRVHVLKDLVKCESKSENEDKPDDQ